MFSCLSRGRSPGAFCRRDEHRPTRRPGPASIDSERRQPGTSAWTSEAGLRTERSKPRQAQRAYSSPASTDQQAGRCLQPQQRVRRLRNKSMRFRGRIGAAAGLHRAGPKEKLRTGVAEFHPCLNRIEFTSPFDTPERYRRSHSFEGCDRAQRWLELNNPPLQSDCHGVSAVISPELPEDTSNVALHSLFGEREPRRNLFVRIAACHQPQYIDFPRGQ